tara:strand:+ start:1813 stop:1959 length:147 start_codon:yes stop_codon:yes gene_type:complete
MISLLGGQLKFIRRMAETKKGLHCCKPFNMVLSVAGEKKWFVSEENPQ